MLPSTFMKLPYWERAFVIASIQIRVEDEKKKEKESQRKARRGRRKK